MGEPTQEDAVEAANYLLKELFSDFPLKDDASKANMLAALISPILRPISGRSPLFVITKPQPGEGSGLLADLVSLVCNGNVAPKQDANCDDKTELRKTLSSLLRSGTELTVFDNLDQNSKFDSPVIAGFLTSDLYRDRLLGQSKIMDLENTMCTFLTGRNVKLGGDIPRRSVLIEMKAMDRELIQNSSKRNFRHPRIQDWVKKHRGELVAKIFTIYRAWVLAGKPTSGVPLIGSFETWCDVVGGMLQYAGISGFLENRTTVWDEMDTETDEWHDFASAWFLTGQQKYDTFKEIKETRHLKAKELLGMIESNRTLLESLPSDLDEPYKKRNVRAIGNRVSSQRNVPLNGYVIRAKIDAKDKIMRYWVEEEAQ